MENTKFKEEIYEPYAECWKILKTLQNKSCFDDDWSEWDRLTREFTENHDTPYGHVLARMLTDAGDIIGKMNGGKL